jgi:cobaltochelatase CobN
VTDKRELGIDAWFEQHNPTAQAQLIERMMEAVRKGYWDADEQTRRELAQRWQALTAEHGGDVGERTTREFIEQAAAGFGLDTGVPEPVAATAAAATPPQPTSAEAAPPDSKPTPTQTAEATTVRGQVMTEVERTVPTAPPWQAWLGGLLLLACGGLGGWRQARTSPFSLSPHTL